MEVEWIRLAIAGVILECEVGERSIVSDIHLRSAVSSDVLFSVHALISTSIN